MRLRAVNAAGPRIFVCRTFEEKTIIWECVGARQILFMVVDVRFLNGQDCSRQSISEYAANNKMVCRARCPHRAGEKRKSFAANLQTICRGRCLHRPADGHEFSCLLKLSCIDYITTQ